MFFKAVMFLIFCNSFLFASLQQVFADVKVQKASDGWKLLVDGKPFFVKGICYTPVNVGESPDEGTQRDWMVVDDDHDGRIDAPYQSWVDVNRNNKQDKNEPTVGDFQLLKDMGCNTIRVYHHASTNSAVQAMYKDQLASPLLYNHEPNKKLLRDLFARFGIRVAMGDLLGAYAIGSGSDWNAGTVYSDEAQQKNMLLSVEAMVRDFKDEPYILMWIIGNENNYEWTRTDAKDHPEVYARFVNKVAQRIKAIDRHHPVCLANGDVHLLSSYAKYTPDVDIFGTNVYRFPDFGDLWAVVAKTYDKPLMLTEYGLPHAKFKNNQLDEKDQSERLILQSCDILKHGAGGAAPQNSIGGFLYEFLDNWWQNGNPNELNRDGENWNNEATGLAGQGDGASSPLLRELRASYVAMKELWRDGKGCR